MVSKYETKAQKQLEADGWIIDYKRSMTRFAKMRDFFNLFDLVAIKKGEPIRYISIKGHIGGSVRTVHSKEIREFWMPVCCQKELWIWPNNKKKKEWIKIVFDNNS